MSETTMTDQATTDAEAAPSAPDQALDHEQDTGGESPDSDADEAQGGPGGNREARYRTQLRAAERERDALREQLATARRETVDDALTAAGLRPALFDAAGLRVEDFTGEDGRVNRSAAVEAARTAASDLGVEGVPRRPVPNPIAGTPSDRAPASGRGAWDAAFGVKG